KPGSDGKVSRTCQIATHLRAGIAAPCTVQQVPTQCLFRVSSGSVPYLPAKSGTPQTRDGFAAAPKMAAMCHADIAHLPHECERGPHVRRPSYVEEGRLAPALAFLDRAHGRADYLKHGIRLRYHGNVRRRHFGRGGFHAYRDKALQIRVNRLVLIGEDIPGRLGLPRRTVDLLVEEVCHWRALCRIHHLLLRLG